jgi:pilus assembly protein Flp/PilA
MGDVVLRDTIPAQLDDPGDTFAEYHVAAFDRSLRDDERGQGLAEYGLILGLIAVLCIAAVLFFSGNLQGLLSNVGSSI